MRIKRGTTKAKHRRNVLSQTKGFRGGLKNKERQAKTALLHAGQHAFNHRRDKKGDFRRLWTVRINAATRPLGLSYSRFIDTLKKKKVGLDRKVLSSIARDNPQSFARIVEKVS
jgi:large subunit ribosomal protein L20